MPDIGLIASKLGAKVSQGGYYKAIYGTPGGTGVVSSTQQTFSTTSAIFEIENPTALNPGANLYTVPDFLRLVVTAVDTAATAFHYCGVSDPKLRYSAGGYQPISPELGPINVLGMNAGGMPQSNVHLGALTLNSAGANRLIDERGTMKINAAAPLTAVGDEFLFCFDEPDTEPAGARGGTVAATYRQNVGVVIVPPTSSYATLSWFPGITGAFTFEFELGFWELIAA